MTKLVIVESPAKAKTISRFLGPGYEVEASFGHVRDLPGNAQEIPLEIKKRPWARLGVNIDDDFQPVYVVPADKKKHVERLRKALKGAKELLLATDEDREGESIVWHLLKLLEPKVPVRRIVFHEITPEAIKEAVANPRDVDEHLVAAQESRRIIDRLYGYTLSPVLWKKVQSGLSAGRVQSVAVRMCVERERQRAAFVASEYWDLLAELKGAERPLKVELARVNDRRIATGKDFDASTGSFKGRGDVEVIDRARAEELRGGLAAARPWRVTSIEETPASSRPSPPFITSTLQQEANRKLGFTARRTMNAAQDLYEGVDLGGGERVGLITYMRTDSLTLAERALEEATRVVKRLYGSEFHPGEPTRYKTRSRNAQEAHEAIRPTELERLPRDVEQYLSRDQARLYELIWKRTIASQMTAAQLKRTVVEVEANTGNIAPVGTRATFTARGKQIIFPGYLRAYVEGSDDPEAELGDQETLLPRLTQGQELTPAIVEAKKHSTQPPARYTEASLIKRLEEEGIGRPSTYASIISTIEDRGYVFVQDKALVPTFTAFAVTGLLERHFGELVDLQFTSRMEEELDRVANGELEQRALLSDFYRGTAREPGLAKQIALREKDIEFPHVPLASPNGGEAIVVKIGRFGPYLQRGEGGPGNTASIPDGIPPADLSYERAREIIDARREGPRALGKDPESGLEVFVMSGRFGPYVQLGPTPEGKLAKGEGPRRASLLPAMTEESVTLKEALGLLRFPRALGANPADGQPVVAMLGRYGPYVKHGTSSRSLAEGDDPLTVTLERALELLAAPPVRQARGGARGGRGAAATPGKVIGKHPASGREIQLRSGRYGPYVTDGETNATLPKGRDPESVSVADAAALIDARAGAAPAKKGAARGGAKGAGKARGAAKGARASAAAPKKKSAPTKKSASPRAGE